ncbi:hypothetical protein DdX_18007 [Ditylenchus destructor]|uniref:Uncharacterized protein n=1 Tax=Ditylenchus destructor TaxID=166010 RepID=A0AAD4MKE6_9BILA|nr:hypothetical protein DdX_18007 [Ditylenchus destructor]
MDTQNVSRRGIKHRRANSPVEQNERLVRKKVNIPDDTWLEALKFLACPDWSQKRFVSRQIDGIAQRNISRLPKMVLDGVSMYYINRGCVFPVNTLDKYAIVSFDAVLQKRQSTQFFKNRGFTLSAPEGIPAKTVLFGARSALDNWTRRYDANVNVCIHGIVKEEVPLSFQEELCPWFQKLRHEGAYSEAMEFRKPVLYYAQFNPALNPCSWDYLAQFLKFVYHPTSYTKEVKMFAVNQNFIDALECNTDSIGHEPRYIHCESFSLLIYILNPAYADIPDSLKWLPQNVRAEKIYLPWILKTSESFGLVTDFLLDPFGAKQCASEMMTIQVINETAFRDHKN